MIQVFALDSSSNLKLIYRTEYEVGGTLEAPRNTEETLETDYSFPTTTRHVL